jgi:hypothetical protein
MGNTNADKWGGDLASNPAVLQVNFRHCRSSPSSDMIGRWIGDGLAARGEGRVRVVEGHSDGDRSDREPDLVERQTDLKFREIET